MIRQQSIISGEYLVFDAIDLIKKGHYKQCFKKINRMVFDPLISKGEPQLLQLQIQLCRRLLYCCNKILKKYFRKFSEKSHKVQPLLNRSIELVFYYIDFLEMFASNNNPQTLEATSPIASPSPTIKKKQFFKELYSESMSLSHKMEMFFSQEYVSNYMPKSNTWFDNQSYHCQILLIETLINTYTYHKLLRTPFTQIFLKQIQLIINNMTFNTTKYSILKGQLQIYIGNAYLEIFEMSKAENHFIQSLDEMFISVKAILNGIEKQKIKMSMETIRNDLSKLISHMIISLELQIIVNKYQEKYYIKQTSFHRCLEISQIAMYLNNVLTYFHSCKELTNHLETKNTEIHDNYKDYVLESMEISKLLSLIFEIPIKEKLNNVSEKINTQILTQAEIYQHQLFEKYNYSQNNKTFLIKSKELPPKPSRPPSQTVLENYTQQSQYFVKNQSMKIFKLKHNSSQHSLEQPSTNYNDSQLQMSNNRNDQSLLSQIDSSNITNITQSNKKLKINPNHRQSFLSDLIHLRNQGQKTIESNKIEETQLEKNHRLQKELLHKISNKNAYQPLNQVIKSYINDNLEGHQKCQSLDEVKKNANQICQAEAEVHKEVPITKSLLQARKITCQQGVVVRDKQPDAEFNKLLEFNVLEYFDFVQTNKEQAVTSLKVQQETKQVRLAQQNLFSENFIPKKKLNFIENEEIKQMEQAQELVAQAESLMKKTFDKRKSASKSQSRISILNFMSEKASKQSKQDTMIPISFDQVVDRAKNSIKNVLSQNEKEKEQIEDEDQQLKETELPFKFKRSFSGKSKKKQDQKSLLLKQGFVHLCSSTKNIRDKDQNNEKKIRGFSLEPMQ